jgi:drug/metabolite transporter (DMT)-like permease
MPMPPFRVLAAYVAVVLVWGSTWAAIKIGVEDLPPFLFAIERALAVAAILTIVAVAFRQAFPRGRRDIAIAAVVGVINTGWSWAIIFWAEQFVPSGLVSVFGASAPVWTAFLAHFTVKGDRLSALKLVGLALGLAGTLLLASAPAGGDDALLASALLVLMSFTWAIAAVLQARFLTRAAPIPTVALGTWASVLFLVPFALTQASEPQRWTVDSVLAFIYLVVFGTCFGMVLSLWLYRKLRPTTITLIQVIVPAEAILIGTLALGEPLTYRMLAGSGLVAVAVGLNAIAGGGAPADREAAVPVAAAD